MITASLGGGEELDDADQKLEMVEDTETSASFRLVPAREDCGKFIRCSSLQTSGRGEALFGGPRTISQKVMTS